VDVARTLEGEVRELIRRSGLDPLRDEPAVRRLVEEAVSDYDERSMHGGLPVLADLGATSKALWDSVIGYGPLQQYFDDASVEEIWAKGRLAPG
jgi:pilus assembly protein CpaF